MGYIPSVCSRGELISLFSPNKCFCAIWISGWWPLPNILKSAAKHLQMFSYLSLLHPSWKIRTPVITGAHLDDPEYCSHLIIHTLITSVNYLFLIWGSIFLGFEIKSLRCGYNWDVYYSPITDIHIYFSFLEIH